MSFFIIRIVCTHFLLFIIGLYSRVSQYVPNFRFFNVFILKQAHLHPKVTKQANFRGSLQNLQAKLKTVQIFSQSPVQKRLKIESQFLAAMLFGPNTSKKYFMFTLIKNQIFMILS